MDTYFHTLHNHAVCVSVCVCVYRDMHKSNMKTMMYIYACLKSDAYIHI